MARVSRRDDDPQAQILYRAERRFQTDPPPSEMLFGSSAEIRRWIGRLFASDEFVEAFPSAAERLDRRVPLVKTHRNKRRIGTYDPNANEIRLSAAYAGVGMTLPVVLHEIAHVVDYFKSHHPSVSWSSHDAEFAAVYLDMVALTLGSEHSDRLQQDFDKAGVEYSERRVHQRTDGMLAAGDLDRPSEVRDEAAVSADLARRLTREVAKRWKRVESFNVDKVDWVGRRKDWLRNQAAHGADLPEQIKLILRHGDDLQAARAELHLHMSRTQTGSGRCGKWMPRACVPCRRTAGHRGPCARQ